MHVGHIELFVSDVSESCDFYVTNFGCEVVVDRGDLCWIKSGDLEILLRQKPEGDGYGSTGAAFVFYSDNLPKSQRDLNALGVEQAGCDGHDYCPLYRDPDGNWIQVVDPNTQT